MLGLCDPWAIMCKEATESMEPFKWAGKELPLCTIVVKVPYIPGKDTPKDDKMPSWIKFNRKALHINTDKSNAKQLQALTQVARDRDRIRHA